MNKQTFEKSADIKQRKENYEWLRLWCEETHKDMPRVAMIGDSIVEQVYEVVKRELKGVAIVDYLATSYAITSPAYIGMVEKFVEDSNYAVIYYNYGLHASNITIEDYTRVYKEMVTKFLTSSKVLLGSTTVVHKQEERDVELENFFVYVRERNEAVKQLAGELGLTLDEAFEISVEMGSDGKSEDGAHFNQKGIERLGVYKAEQIKKILQ